MVVAAVNETAVGTGQCMVKVKGSVAAAIAPAGKTGGLSCIT
jgi:hypothetical protein